MCPQHHNALAAKRHSLAHLLAAATLQLYPHAKITLGPAVDNGFYYDIDFGETKISDKELPKILKAMKKSINTWEVFHQIPVSADEARQLFADNPYKLELIEEIAQRGEDITLYYSGPEANIPTKDNLLAHGLDIKPGFVDLCRGGHVDNMKSEVSTDTFILDRVAGAYWRGDENNPMLTRIYGLAFNSKEELDAYLTLREKAKQRDHRKIGQQLNLYTMSDLVGPGLPLFTPKGTLLRDLIMDKIQTLQKELGYQRVATPHITKKELYETSGHWAKFGDELFKVKGQSDQEFVMKPMNCPHHTQIYASQNRSYRDLPIRFMELGVVYRDEQAGELLGLSRVRSISQDDGHVFCRPDQVEQEISNIVTVIQEFYTSLDMLNDGDYWVSVSVRDPQNLEKYLGKDENWEIAEKALTEVAEKFNLPFRRVEGEAAFYGPKLDFQFRDALGREWQLGTAQLDFVMPERFGLEYTDTDGEKKTPVMIHRAIAGSLERFLSVVIEHFAGHFPLWLSPVQVAVLPISSDNHGDYTSDVVKQLHTAGIRVEHYDENESLGKRIRNAKMQKIPYLIIVGDSEIQSNVITVEGRDDLKLENITVDDFITRLNNEVEGKK
ncbi:threonine--tRNA ligase [Candidatus Nomurabacteria bacterium]|nr:threonine--tRNA ligase [Candidatus Nomurabacteria bacterium]